MTDIPALLALVSLSLLASPAVAQEGLPLYGTDAGLDGIVRFVDLDGDGTYMGPGEATLFYDDTLGPFVLSNNLGIEVDRAEDSVWICDSTEDQVFAFRDLNRDGDAHDPGEAWTFFDGRPGGNVPGVIMSSAQSLSFSQGILWVAVADTSAPGPDMVLRLEDLNGDEDANDSGEASAYFVPATAGSVGDSLPTDAQVGLDGAVYYVENGSTGFIPKGVYRLDDSNSNGVIEPNEVSAYFLPAQQAATAFHWTLEQDWHGFWYLGDQGNELIWRFRDADGNGSVDPLAEATILWAGASASTIWDVRVAADGSIYAAESQTPERVLRMFDANHDGAIDPANEVAEIYVGSTGPVLLSNLRGIAFELAPFEVPAAFCTAKVTSIGCTPMVTWMGAASATQGQGFEVGVSGICPSAVAMLVHSTAAPVALPFQGGVLCVAPPLVRSPPVTSTNSPACLAFARTDFNVIAASGSNPALIPGATVCAQWWSRDNGDPFGSNLSNALGFVLAP